MHSAYPALFATLGDAIERVPPDVAPALELALAAAAPPPRPSGPPAAARTRAGLAAARLRCVIELLHAAECARAGSRQGDQLSDGAREGLLLAGCCLTEHITRGIAAF